MPTNQQLINGFTSGGQRNGGRNAYDTQVAKFLYGGRLDNIFAGHNKIVNGMEDPSFFAFNFGIDEVTTGLFSIKNGADNPMEYDMETDRHYSVINYLKNAVSPNAKDLSGRADSNGMYFMDLDGAGTESYGSVSAKYMTFPAEYADMLKFTEGFHEITVKHPYMLQTIEGLQDAYKKYYNPHKDPYLGGGTDTKIKITCLESMDLRMSALFDAYYRAVYNHRYRRMNIPRNLLRFDCWVLVHDLRNIAADDPDTLNFALNQNVMNITLGSHVDEKIIKNLSTVLFRFKNCIFDIEDIGAEFETVNNAEANQTKFAFSFIYNDVDVYINSLADLLEADRRGEDISGVYRERYDKLDIVSLNDRPKARKTADLGNGYADDTYRLGGLLKNIGSSVFNYVTQGSTMGNIYDDSWAGILSSMMSSISNVGVGSVIRNLAGQGINLGKQKLREYADKVMGFNKERDEIKDPYTNTVYNSGGRNAAVSTMSEFDNVYDGSAETQHERLLADNIYTDSPDQHEEIQADNVYEGVSEPHANDYSEPLFEEPTGENRFTGGTIDMSTNGRHQQMEPEDVYDEPPAPEPYEVEYTDMSTNGQHQEIEEGNVYSGTPAEMHYGDLGSVYTISEKHETVIPVNVYDRIIKSAKHDIEIEKIFIPPAKAPSLETEYVGEPVKETKPHTFEENSAYTKEAKEKIKKQILSIGNIYE